MESKYIKCVLFGMGALAAGGTLFYIILNKLDKCIEKRQRAKSLDKIAKDSNLSFQEAFGDVPCLPDFKNPVYN